MKFKCHGYKIEYTEMDHLGRLEDIQEDISLAHNDNVDVVADYDGDNVIVEITGDANESTVMEILNEQFTTISKE